MKRATLIGVFVLAFVLDFQIPASAVVTDWQVVKYYPALYYGDAISCDVYSSGSEPIAGYNWEMKANSEDDSNYFSFSTEMNFSAEIMTRIGQLDIRLTVKYGTTSGMPDPHVDTVIVHTVTVLPPDGNRIQSGLNIDIPINSESTNMDFILTGDGRDLNLYASIIAAQEKFLSIETNPASAQPWDYGLNVWYPAPPDSAPAFWGWDAQTILDCKRVYDNRDNVFLSIASGDWIFKYTQVNQVNLPNVDSTSQWYELPTQFALELYKVDAGTWQNRMQ